MSTATANAVVPVPDGMTADNWYGLPDQMAHRGISTPKAETGREDVDLWALAFQWANGTITVGDNAVHLEVINAAREDGISTDEARQLGAALIELADKLDRLTD